MHSANVIHRDLKPSNLLLVTNHSYRIKIVTFRFVIWVWQEGMCKRKKKKLSMLLRDGIVLQKLF